MIASVPDPSESVPPGLEVDPETGRVVAVRAKAIARFTPNEMDVLKAETGRSLGQMQENEADGIRVLIWMTCRRAGRPVTWEEAGDIEVEFEAPQDVDPTSGGSTTNEPPSAATSTLPRPTSMP